MCLSLRAELAEAESPGETWPDSLTGTGETGNPFVSSLVNRSCDLIGSGLDSRPLARRSSGGAVHTPLFLLPPLPGGWPLKKGPERLSRDLVGVCVRVCFQGSVSRGTREEISHQLAPGNTQQQGPTPESPPPTAHSQQTITANSLGRGFYIY